MWFFIFPRHENWNDGPRVESFRVVFIPFESNGMQIVDEIRSIFNIIDLLLLLFPLLTQIIIITNNKQQQIIISLSLSLFFSIDIFFI